MASTDYTGETLDDRYRVDELVGQGGMGKVYLGSHARVGRKVAIKVLNPDLAHDEDMVKRFFREARAAAAIGHRHIIDVLDVGVTAAGDPYLVMEYLEGESLAALLSRTGPLDLAAATAIVEPVLQALGAAHKAGIVHRDLKPENIFVTYPDDGPPEVKLIDFGISKVTEETQSTRLTDTGQLLGTPAYMAPEQAEDAVEVDHRTDLYAVGVILYELLCGVPPFDATSNYKLFAQVLRGEITPPKQANPDFPVHAEPVVAKAMAREPADRHADAAAMLDELRELCTETQRGKALALLAEGAIETTVPQGALGDRSADGTAADAEAVLAELVDRGPSSAVRADPPEPANRWARPALLLVLGAAAVLVWFGLRGHDEPGTEASTTSAAPSASTASVDDTVEITLRGIPDGAAIVYDSAPVPGNPFRARRSPALVPLRVTAPGYEPRSLSVRPDRDQLINLPLTAIGVASAAPTSSSSVPTATRPVVPPRPTGTATRSGSQLPKGIRPDFE